MLTKKNKTKQNKTKQNKTSKTNKKHSLVKKDANVEPEPLYYSGFQIEYNKENKSYAKLSKDLIKIFKNIDKIKTNENPNNDFYNYVNKMWIEETQISKNQEYIIQVDDFRLVQDKVYHELLDIVEYYINNNNSNHATQMKNLYYSFKKGSTINQVKNRVKNIINEFDSISRDKNNLWKMMGDLNKNDLYAYAAPFSFSLNPDNKQSNIFRCYINSPKLTLIDLSVYFDDGTDIEYKNNYRKKYFEFLSKLFYVTLGPNNNINVKDIYDVEVDILNAIGSQDPTIIESPDYYNKLTAKEALKYGFNWEEFSRGLGFSYVPEFFITSNLNYLKAASKMLNDNWTSEKWKNYFLYIYIRHSIRICHEYRSIWFDFMGKFMTGSKSMMDLRLNSIFGLGYAYNTFLSNKYIENNKREETVQYLTNMTFDLKEVFTKIITQNKWLQQKTKKYALLKLKHMKLIVGSPLVIAQDPDLSYDINNPMENLKNIAMWRHEKFINLEGREVIDFPTIDWSVVPPKLVGTQSYIVNASYTPSKNAIYVPLGYIQKPFIDLNERGIEYNLAHVGFTLGHEMSHALDDWGSQYDYKGNLNNWWTPKDKLYFKNLQKDVVNQYEAFAKRDGIDFDASIGIGEDLADISGLNICNEYLAEFQEKNDDIYFIRKLSFRAFYLYYAYQMRQKLSKEAISAQTKTNPHPLDKYRTNIPLSRLELFREMYNIKKGDKMFWATGKNIW